MIVALALVIVPLTFAVGYHLGRARNRALVLTALRETAILRARQEAKAYAAGYRFDANHRLVPIEPVGTRLSDV